MFWQSLYYTVQKYRRVMPFMTYSEVSRKKPELIFRDEVRPVRFCWDFLQRQPAGALGSDRSISPIPKNQN